ncbi:uncharacterized protein I303_100908 [Kwoniella dejecticola CBS 10117]|uniref:Zn(2)-C6 fungal-type domain-containing protein n=1 Tax=Kwoniella dejecticola CBS 10117 TaxID=1296121 RepID=A0A1A6AG89_9TREE|nr:uncharacterized protein I303_00912 [Kwoniella dejecticola CBS 10117]OBR89090.1 hypothetical protein I303_00912 [Kwoniella dejecticola CBS 10117]
MPRPGDQQRPGRKRRSCDSCFVSKTSCNPPTDGTACSSSTRKGIECVNSQGTVLSRPRDDSQRDDGQPASIDDYTATQRIYYQGQPGTYFVDTQQFTAETAYNTGTRTGYNVSSGGPSVAGPNGSNYPAFPLPEQSSATFNQQTRNWYSGQPGVYEVSTTAAPALPTAQ